MRSIFFKKSGSKKTWQHFVSESEQGFALTGYDIPGCVEDGARMLWENSSVAAVAAAVAAAAVAHPDLE